MAYAHSKFNNIGGSMGLSNLWIYTDTSETVATLDADNYICTGSEIGLKLNDIVVFCGSDGCSMGMLTTLSSSASVVTTLAAVA